MRSPLLLLLWSMLPLALASQPLQIESGQPAAELVRRTLARSDVRIVAVEFGGDPDQLGRFDDPSGQTGLSRGLILSTGRVRDAAGPNLYTGIGPDNQPDQLADANTDFGQGPLPDPDLNRLLPQGRFHDRVFLRIRFIPLTDTVGFRFVFASEEYPEFTPPRSPPDDPRAAINDLFAFVVRGAGLPPNGLNLATLPDGSPVSLRTINPSTNSALYRDNSDPTAPLWLTTAYDGLSVVLAAGLRLEACTEYEIYLVLADVQDGQVDTALLIEGGSFGGSAPSIGAAGLGTRPDGSPFTWEGCGIGTARFTLERPDPADELTLDLTIGGTASPGLDYEVLPDRITLAPGQQRIDLAVLTLWDDLYPPDEDEYESIILSYTLPAAQCPNFAVVSDTLWIRHTDSLRIEPQVPATACVPTDLRLNARVTGGTGSYLYEWLDGVSGLQPSPETTVPFTADRTFALEARDRTCLGIPRNRASAGIRAINRDPAAPPLRFAQLSTDTILCTGQSVELLARAEGGTGTYTYLWQDLERPTGDTLVQPDRSTRYTVRVSDGCDEISASVWVNVFEPVDVELTANPAGPYCAGRPVQLIAQGRGGSGTYTYRWDDGSTTAQRLVRPEETTSYSVEVSDRCGTATASLRLPVEPPLQLVLIQADTTICRGQNVVLRTVVAGGDGRYRLVWNQGLPEGPDPMVAPAATTVYRVIVTDGCGSAPVTGSVEVEVLEATEALRIERIEGPDTVCPGQAATWTVRAAGGTGAYSYRFNGGPWQASNQFTVSPTNASRFVFEVKDTCSVIFLEKEINIYSNPEPEIRSIPDTLCVGQTARLLATVRGGQAPYSYRWSTDESTPEIEVSPEQTTSYRVEVRDACGLSGTSADLSLPVRPPLAVRIEGARNVCLNERLELLARPSGGDGRYRYRWSTGDTTPRLRILPRRSDTWSLTLTDGCGSTAAEAQVSITVLPGVQIAYSLSPDPQCARQPMELRFTGFAPPDAVVSWEWGELTANANDLGPIRITAPGPGTWPVRLRISSARCGTADSSFSLRFTPDPLAFFAPPAEQCFGGHSFAFEALEQPAGAVYRWDFGPEATPATAEGRQASGIRFARAGSYAVRLRVSIGDCSDEMTQNVRLLESPAPPRTRPDTLCNGRRARLQVIDADPQLSYRWFASAADTLPLGSGRVYETPPLLRNATFYVEAIGPNGCRSVPRGVAEVEVRGPGRLAIFADKDSVNIPLGVVSFRASYDREPEFWLWNFGDGGQSTAPNPTHVYREAGIYRPSLTVSDRFGCVGSAVAEQAIVVREPVLLHVPDAFSPDDNYVNDEWFVVHRLIRDFEVKVYDRWGNIVFESTDPNFRWYGDIKGRDFRTRVTEGVYVWRIRAKAYDGTPINMTGTLTVVYRGR